MQKNISRLSFGSREIAERFVSGGDGAVDVGDGVRGRKEHRLELRRWDVYAASKHAMEKFGELRRVGGASLVGVAHLLRAEEHREQRAGAIDASGLAGFLERVAKARVEARAGGVERGIRIALFQDA